MNNISKIELIKKFIEQYIDEQPNVNLSYFLSEKMCCHKSKVHYTFTKTEGKTIHDYYMEKRIEKVKPLLVQGKGVGEIATILRYSDGAALTKQFKRITGINPLQYKKLTLNQLKQVA